MADLVAKAVLTADASGLVGAAKEGEAALDSLNAKANAGGDGTGAVKALESQTTAQKKLTETTHVGRAAAAANVVQLRNVAAASTGLSAATKTATVNGEAMGTMLVGLGRQGGMAGEKLELARASLKALGGVMASNPILLAATAAAAAVVTLAKATDGYNVSVGKLNIAAMAHGDALVTVGLKYGTLIDRMADVSDVSVKTAREIAAGLMDANIDASQWVQVTAVAKNYAAVLGTDVATAAAKLADELQSPSDMAIELTKKYGLLDTATIAHIRRLEQAGQKIEAQTIVTKAWGDRIKYASDQTSGWARAWNSVSTEVSGAWDKLGQVLFPNTQSPEFKLKQLNQELEAARKNITSRDWRQDASGNITYRAPRAVEQILADIARVKKAIKDAAARPKDNTEALDLSIIVSGYSSGQIDAQIAKLQAERERILAAQKKRLALKNPDTGQAITYEAALAANTQATNKALKDKRDALLALNPEAQKWAETIKSLIHGSAQEVKEAQRSAEAAKGRLDAYGKGALALQAFDDQLARSSAVSQLSIAADHASGAEKKRLLEIIKSVTSAMIDQAAATHELETRQDLTSKIGSLSTTGLDASATAALSAKQFDIAKRALDEWRQKAIADLNPANNGYEEFRAYVDQVYNSDLAKLYDADLERRKDWASGVASANQEMVRSTQDMASQSKKLLQGWNSTAENIFVQFAQTGKINTTSLVDYIIAELARLAYAKYLAATVSSIGSSFLDGLASAIGIDTGSTSTTAAVGKSHTGGMGGSPPAYAWATADLFAGARRYHDGKRGAVASALDQLASNERPVIVTSDEEIVTAADSSAAASALTQPVAVSVQPSQPNVTVNTYNNSSSQVQTTATTDDQGNITIETLVDEIDSRLSDRMYSGRSATGDTMQSLYGARRRVTT